MIAWFAEVKALFILLSRSKKNRCDNINKWFAGETFHFEFSIVKRDNEKFILNCVTHQEAPGELCAPPTCCKNES